MSDEWYAYVEPSITGVSGALVVRTRAQILDEYGPMWRERMRRIGKEDQINDDHCIEDYCAVHWAWRITASSGGQHSE